MTGRPNQTAPAAAATTRTRSESVTFTRPFRLSVLDDRQPAGQYIVETDEEMIGSVSFPAYQRTATWIRLPSGTRRAGVAAALDRLVNVDRADLDAAIARDLASETEAPAAAAPERASAGEAHRMSMSAYHASAVAQVSGRAGSPIGFTVWDWLERNRSDLTWIALGLVALLTLSILMPFDIPAR